jgi:hypothetical protein
MAKIEGWGGILEAGCDQFITQKKKKKVPGIAESLCTTHIKR